MLAPELRLLTDVKKLMDKRAAAVRKAASLAVSVEAFRLRKEGQLALKLGRLGLVPTSVLQAGRKRKARAPLSGLFRGLVYRVDRANLTASVGFLGGSAGTDWQAKIAERHADGFTWLYTPQQRERLHHAGIHLRKATTSAPVPQREIMAAIVEQQGGELRISQNIARNFEAKMRGEQI